MGLYWFESEQVNDFLRLQVGSAGSLASRRLPLPVGVIDPDNVGYTAKASVGTGTSPIASMRPLYQHAVPIRAVCSRAT
jgi:hypothetical protein